MARRTKAFSSWRPCNKVLRPKCSAVTMIQPNLGALRRKIVGLKIHPAVCVFLVEERFSIQIPKAIVSWYFPLYVLWSFPVIWSLEDVSRMIEINVYDKCINWWQAGTQVVRLLGDEVVTPLLLQIWRNQKNRLKPESLEKKEIPQRNRQTEAL